MNTRIACALLFACARAAADERADERTNAKEPLELSAVWTLGFGKTPAVDVPPTRPRLLDAQIGLNAFVIGARFEPRKEISLSSRLPFAIGNFAGSGDFVYQGGHAIALGNIEIAGAWRTTSDALALDVGLALTVPSSLGAEIPTSQAELDARGVDTFDASDALRYSLLQATAAAFGYEEDALFWSRRFGVTPSVRGAWSSGALYATPFIKVPNLIDTQATSLERYRVEIVFGSGVGARLFGWLDLGARVWGSVTPIRRKASPTGAGVIEPELRVSFGEHRASSFFVAGVLPFVGSSVDPFYFGAVRAGIAGAF